MRADRLVSILLMLQQRNQITAAEVASELEISQRTARRDLDALGVAGLPVYSVQGRHGGWRLAGGGKTDLSGLSSSEVRALFMVAAVTFDDVAQRADDLVTDRAAKAAAGRAYGRWQSVNVGHFGFPFRRSPIEVITVFLLLFRNRWTAS